MGLSGRGNRGKTVQLASADRPANVDTIDQMVLLTGSIFAPTLPSPGKRMFANGYLWAGGGRKLLKEGACSPFL